MPRSRWLGLVSRLVHQKGIDLVLAALPELLGLPIQFVAIGSGEPEYERALRAAALRSPSRSPCSPATTRRSRTVSRRAPIFFSCRRASSPAASASCTACVTAACRWCRRVGGLADTVTDATPDALAAGTATGIVFDAPTPAALVHAVKRALALRQNARLWKQIQLTGMRQDFSWQHSAADYLRLYEEALSDRPLPHKE